MLLSKFFFIIYYFFSIILKNKLKLNDIKFIELKKLMKLKNIAHIQNYFLKILNGFLKIKIRNFLFILINIMKLNI